MYECPNCGQNIKFSIEKQAMYCEYCGTVMAPDEVKDTHAVNETTVNDGTMEVKIMTCPQCGGEIICDDNEATTFCSYCGASTMLESRISRTRRPERIIPFKKTKDDCVKAYMSMMKKALFAPKDAKSPENIESFRAIYMPYWVYDFDYKGPVNYVGKVQYQRGDYEYTDHYSINTNVDMSYKGVNYDASSTFSDNISGSLAPFKAGESVDFTTAYMSGFYADICDVNENLYEKDAKTAVAEDVANDIASDWESRKHGADRKSIISDVDPRTSSKKLAMFPVWFMSYRKVNRKGEERVLYAAVNAQTGKAVADIPIDYTKFAIGTGILSVLLFLFFNFFMTLKPMPLMIVAAVLAVIFTILYFSQMQALKDWESNADDKGYRSVMKIKRSKNKEKIKSPVGIGLVLVIVLTVGLLVFQPVSDAYYYSGVIIALLFDGFILSNLITKYNDLASRPLPQFKRKGGDDSAK